MEPVDKKINYFYDRNRRQLRFISSLKEPSRAHKKFEYQIKCLIDVLVNVFSILFSNF